LEVLGGAVTILCSPHFPSAITAGAQGGAIKLLNSKIGIDRCIFHRNAAVSTSGISSGGALYLNQSRATIRQTTFALNAANGSHQASDSAGGAIFADGSPALAASGELPVLDDDVDDDDDGDDDSKKHLEVSNGTMVTLDSCMFTRNHVRDTLPYGFALALAHLQATVANCTFEGHHYDPAMKNTNGTHEAMYPPHPAPPPPSLLPSSPLPLAPPIRLPHFLSLLFSVLSITFLSTRLF
jgi:hypothetical protein